MSRKSLAGAAAVSVFALLMMFTLAAPAAAQTGGVRGKVVDEAGKPVPDVQVLLVNPETLASVTLKTDAKGEFFRIGMIPGDYSVKANKGPLSASLQRMHVSIADVVSIETLTLRAGGARPAAEGGGNDGGAAKKAAELQNQFKEAKGLADAGKFDE